MPMTEIMYRKNRTLELITDITEKGCGNCGEGIVDKEYFVKCLLPTGPVGWVYDPDFMCDQYKKCQRILLLHAEAQLNKIDIKV
jgi:hypothetical protein